MNYFCVIFFMAMDKFKLSGLKGKNSSLYFCMYLSMKYIFLLTFFLTFMTVDRKYLHQRLKKENCQLTFQAFTESLY